MTRASTSIEFAGLQGKCVSGDGPRILWIHGYSLDATSWQDIWERLPRCHHVGVDLPGHGNSPLMEPDENLSSLGVRLADACREHEVSHIVAISYGTMAALQAAIERPQFFDSITLGAPALAGGERDPDVERAYMSMFGLYHRGAAKSEVAAAWMSCRAWDGIKQHPELETRLGSIVDRHEWRELADFHTSLRMTSPAQSIEHVAGIESSVLVLIGEHEMPAFRQTAQLLKEHIRNCTVRQIRDVGHLCQLEAPDLCAPLIANHIAQASPSTSEWAGE